MNKMQIRQGDVLLTEVDVIPCDAVVMPRENGRIVLARGEATGHAHVIIESGVDMLQTERGGVVERYIRAIAPFTVQHEEHSTHFAPKKSFTVTIQCEYTPAAPRQVVD